MNLIAASNSELSQIGVSSLLLQPIILPVLTDAGESDPDDSQSTVGLPKTNFHPPYTEGIIAYV